MTRAAQWSGAPNADFAPSVVPGTGWLAAITTPTIFILGSDDPYLSIERARTSIDQIQGARLYAVPGGHAPWLADARHAAGLIATHAHVTARQPPSRIPCATGCGTCPPG